nr:MAG TPA: hypothetical protein [Caudoviricetes sp.]
MSGLPFLCIHGMHGCNGATRSYIVSQNED